jgi:uncharacterized surface protein with fasciclin (FAS1) repeats
MYYYDQFISPIILCLFYVIHIFFKYPSSFRLIASWTMFAPTNEAFVALDNDFDAFDNISIDDITETDLVDFIKFHLIYGVTLYRNDFSCFSTLNTMANGEDSRLMCKDNQSFAVKGVGNDKLFLPKFTSNRTEINACNGAIHAIDQVLLYKTKLERKENNSK